MTNESAFFIEPKIVFGEIQPLLENNFSLFQIHRKKPYPLLLLNVMLEFRSFAMNIHGAETLFGFFTIILNIGTIRFSF